MESARRDLNLYAASGACVAVPLADGGVRPLIGGSAGFPKLFRAVRCAALPFSPVDALKILRDDRRCIRNSMARAITVAA